MDVFFYRTKWALLLYLLYNNNWKHTLFCFYSWKDVPSIMKQEGISYFVLHKKNKYGQTVYKLIRWLVDTLRGILFVIRLKAKNKKKSFNFFGDDDNVLSKCFINSDFCVVEDGLANYTPDTIIQLHELGIMGLGARYIPMGVDNIIRKVIFSGALKIPEKMKNKAIVVNIADKWKEKNENERQEILSVFGTSIKELQKFNKKIVLLTQNFNDYELEKEIKEEVVYHKILKNYPQYDILIKPHPFSKVDYEKIFPQYEVLKSEIPFELLALYHKFNRVVSINSTAAFTVPNYDYVDLYDIQGKLYKTFEANGEKIDPKEIRCVVPPIKGIKEKKKNGNFIKKGILYIYKKIFWSVK